ncbi:caspase-8-like [Pholidichthys leucotaenia]
MDRVLLSRIDEDLVSEEVAELCFLCLDFISRRRLEGIKDAKALFVKLEERRLLDNTIFLSDLLRTIGRADLCKLLETDKREEETDASPMLSNYRVMLYKVYEDMTQDHLDKMKFLLRDKLSNQMGRRQMELSKTALDVFAEMEKIDMLSNTNVRVLYNVLKDLQDENLASIVGDYMNGIPPEPPQPVLPPCSITDNQSTVSSINNNSERKPVPVSETDPSSELDIVVSDAQQDKESNPPPSVLDPKEFYILTRRPRGLCVVFNNENFLGSDLQNRPGTQEDAKALDTMFNRLGFTVKIHDDLKAADIRKAIQKYGKRDFLDDDILVVCVLSHGEKECVFGTDGRKVLIKDLTYPFTSEKAPTLAGKPKLFFIQACQGDRYQVGYLPSPPRPAEPQEMQSNLEEDAGPVPGEKIPAQADFLLGMATVQECKSFRNRITGSIYIQELCRQLTSSAESSENDDILTVLTRVNREVSKGEYLSAKQMPEPKYTLTKKLVLKFV